MRGRTTQRRNLLLAMCALAVLSAFVAVFLVVKSPAATARSTRGRLMTVYDRGERRTFLTDAPTIQQALTKAGVALDARDTVEPSRDEELVAAEYKVNIYRARPVVVVDGLVRTKIVTPYQTAARIAKDANINLSPEDLATVSQSSDLVGDGAGLQLTIKRAVPFSLDLYGRKTEARTQGTTVEAMLKEKSITLGSKNRISVPLDTKLVSGMSVRIWREGKQTISLDEPISFETERVFDADRLIGYKSITTPGKLGLKTVSYEIEIKDGVELSRKEIAQLVMQQPVTQVETLGIKPGPNALTKAKGAQYYTDSNGINHRETYYDLNMSVVMQACGQGGYYTVRPDGVKVDRAGYVLIAANYGRYPRCSIVETSVGPGRVYDTGGFATRYPDGFDLATDWTNYDGR